MTPQPPSNYSVPIEKEDEKNDGEEWACPHCGKKNPMYNRLRWTGNEKREQQMCNHCRRYKWDIKQEAYYIHDKKRDVYRSVCVKGHICISPDFDGKCPECGASIGKEGGV